MNINTLELHRKIEEAIAKAERNTSAELRVHLEEKCSEEPLDRACFIFEKLEMHKTDARNGVLIYVAFNDRKMAIVGDAGINAHLEPNTWENIKDQMTIDFSKGNYEIGLCAAILTIGEQLKQFFPYHHEDQNELPNSVSTHPF